MFSECQLWTSLKFCGFFCPSECHRRFIPNVTFCGLHCSRRSSCCSGWDPTIQDLNFIYGVVTEIRIKSLDCDHKWSRNHLLAEVTGHKSHIYFNLGVKVTVWHSKIVLQKECGKLIQTCLEEHAKVLQCCGLNAYRDKWKQHHEQLTSWTTFWCVLSFHNIIFILLVSAWVSLLSAERLFPDLCWCIRHNDSCISEEQDK